jgi:hypothetical protein
MSFKALAKSLSESEFKQDLTQTEKHPSFEVNYQKVAVNPDENLAVVKRMGWDTEAGSTHNFTILHIPTRSDLGFLFTNLDEAEKFMKELTEKYDWNFSVMGGPESKKIPQQQLYIMAAKHNARNILGSLILKDTRV